MRVLVVGEFKQGKSQLVNSLVSAPVCPVDDDIATSVPTVVRHADTRRSRWSAIGDGNGSRSAPRSARRAGRVRVGGGQPRQPGRGCATPRSASRAPLLAGGWCWSTPPVSAGWGRRTGRRPCAALAGADAVLMVSAAAQEYTRPELDFLAAAVRMCPNVACVLTKTDLYPQWRRIAELDRGHLAAADITADLIPVSSAVRGGAAAKSKTRSTTSPASRS